MPVTNSDGRSANGFLIILSGLLSVEGGYIGTVIDRENGIIAQKKLTSDFH